MTLLSALTLISSGLACLFFCLRGNALKQEYAGDHAASDSVRFWILIQAATAGFHAQAVFFTGEATWTEAVLAASGLGYAFCMWLNVRKHVPYARHGGALAR